jgi:hypothetical protein
MMINRRGFIRDAAILVTIPALGGSRSFSSTVQAHASTPAHSLPAEIDLLAADLNSIVFRIEGWDCCEVPSVDCLSANRDAIKSTTNELSIRISQSWRTAWR